LVSTLKGFVIEKLNKEWKESVDIAGKKPDLKGLDAELKAWWDARKTGQ
jgi:hypothetical protein